MNPLHVLIPAKAFDCAKRRLAPILGTGERAAVSRAMLENTVRTVRRAAPRATITMVTRDPGAGEAGRAAGADAIHSAGISGLNDELALAAAEVPWNADLLVLHADLPLLKIADIHAMLTGPAIMAIAPDHAGSGTNALRLRGPARVPFAFGPGSRERHCAIADESDLTLGIVERPGLSRDLDTPADLRRFIAQIKGDGRSPVSSPLPAFIRTAISSIPVSPAPALP